MRKIIVIASKPGKLGNLLTVFSHFIAYSLEHNYLLYNPAFHEYASLFRGSSKNRLRLLLDNLNYRFSFYFARTIDKLKLNSAWVQVIYLDWDQKINLDTCEFKSRITFVQGWGYRSIEIMKKHRPYIRNFFIPASPNYEMIQKHKEGRIPKNKVIVGVHIRHGDYQFFENGKYFYSIAQYRALMDSVVQLFDQEVFFVICSNINFDESEMQGLQYQKGLGSVIGDLYILAACQYIIGPPSTFTGWSSFYGQVPLYHVYNTEEPFKLSNFQVFEIP